MKSLKIIVSSIILAIFVFISPQKTNALTIEEMIKDISSLQPTNIADIKAAVNYDYQKNIEEISSILDESLNSSKDANEKLVELNSLMNSINNDNKALLTVKDKTEYDKSVALLQEKVEEAKQINANAKISSQDGLDTYNEALVKYVSLKSELEAKKEEAEAILNNNISTVKTELDIIDDLLEELNETENKLKEAYDEANIAYESAKENANIANNNFSEKLEELKEYVEVTSEQELNDLIEVNTNYIASGVLYATSQVALKLIDVEIELVEAEIASLKEDLALLDEELLSYKEALTNKENELANLNTELDSLKESLNNNGKANELETQISNEKSALQILIDARNNQVNEKEICSNYIADLKDAIDKKDEEKVIELLFENEKDYGFFGQDVEVTTEVQINSSFETVNFVVVTDKDNKKHYYSYEESDNIITIYEQNFVAEHAVDEMSSDLANGKYLAYTNDTIFEKIINIKVAEIIKKFGLNLEELGFNLEELGLNYEFTGYVVDNKYYEVRREANSWVSVEKKIDVTYKYLGPIPYIDDIKLVDVANTKKTITVTEAAHYEKGQQYGVNSQEIINKCDAITTNSIDSSISAKEKEIKDLEDKLIIAKSLETQIFEKEVEITTKESEVTVAETELNNQKEKLTSAKGMTYAEIETKLVELDEKLNHYPTLGDDNFVEDLASIEDVTKLITNATQGNIDVQTIIETINNLNVGLNIKKRIISEIDTILANNYNDAKQELIDIAGEDLENISNILKEIAPLISEVAESNLKLLEEKTKYELVKASYNALIDAKELVLETKEEVLNELEELEQLKEENNFDLSDLDTKFEETKEALISVNYEVEVKINDYVIVEDKKENNDTDVKEENNTNKNHANKNDKDNSTNNEEEKVENNTPEKEDSNQEVFDPEEEFNWLNLLWLLPIAIIIFFIIIFIKRKKDEE